ncbi:recombinase family protein [Kitasatospora sp. NPDC051164]|uniref:recombinase family protein n=1 Tax=Kitasatospora sp. NPDC051164 TaxID=3364055 RepID=UPI00379A983B
MLPKKAILLVRISDDREGEGLGVGRQENDGRRHADRIGWTIAEVIIENDTSAFKRRKVRLPDGTTALRVIRPGFRRSLDLLRLGERDGLMAYDLDRAVRDPRDLEDLIDLVESTNPRLPVASVTGSLRLDNDADITMARVMVAVANKSSRDTSRRVARKHEQLAEQGKPSGGGRRAFGYEPDGMRIRESEAEVIREMARLVLDGASLYEIVDYANDAIRPAYADRWNTRSIKTILAGPRVAGLRVFRGEVVGEAAWDAILPRDIWDQVVEILAQNQARHSPATNALSRWLNQLLICSLCEALLVGWSGRYWCATPRGGCGKIAMDAKRAEAEVERQVLEYLGEPGVMTLMRDATAPMTADAARESLAEDEEQLKQLAGMWARKEIGFGEYTEARNIITARVKESQALVTASLPRAVRGLLQASDLGAEWKAMHPPEKRDVVRAIVGAYRVLPGSPGLKVFEPERLVPIER